MFDCSLHAGGTVVEAKGDEMTRYSEGTVCDLRQECGHLSPVYVDLSLVPYRSG